MNKVKSREFKVIPSKDGLIELIRSKAGEIVVFDGISGTGKSFLVEFLLKIFGIDEDIAEKQNGKFGMDTDMFLGQNTDNLEEIISFSYRRVKISNLLKDSRNTEEFIDNLKKVYRNEKHLTKVLKNILYALENNISSLTRKDLFLYNRGEGVIKKGRIEIEINKLLAYLVGGTNLSKVAKLTSEKINTILLYSDPQISLLAALYRDFGKGKLDGAARFNFRIQETFGLDKIQQENIEAGYIDYLFKDETVFETMIKKYKEQNDTCETGHCLSDFMKKIESIFKETENSGFYEKTDNKEFLEFKRSFWKKAHIIARKYFPDENLKLDI